jgi:hypothetical protein
MKSLVRLLAGGIAVLSVAGVANAQYGQISPAPAQAVPAPQAPTPPAAPLAAPAKPEDARKKAPSKTGKAPTKPVPQDSECAFTGKRIVSSLARDDVDAAQKFVRFYEMFSCPSEHIRAAFRCVVAGGAPAPGKALSDRVDQCWDRPTMQFLNR